jgi:hypothetical protein
MATEGEVRVRVPVDPSANIREFFVARQICDVPFAEFVRPLWGADEEFSHLGETGEEIARSLLMGDTSGEVEGIFMRYNYLEVYKTNRADWDELEHSIKKVLEEALGMELELRHDTIAIGTLAHAGAR